MFTIELLQQETECNPTIPRRLRRGRSTLVTRSIPVMGTIAEVAVVHPDTGEIRPVQEFGGGPIWIRESDGRCWYFGRDLSRQYPDRVKAWLQSPPVLLGTNAWFSFRHWLNTEALKDACTRIQRFCGNLR